MNNKKVLKLTKEILMIVVGSFLLAASFVFFISPYKMAPGGVYGISIIIHHLFGTPLGTVALCLDIPILLLGFKLLGGGFGLKTILSSVLTAVFTDLLNYLWASDKPLIENDLFLSSIVGGALLGFSLGIIVRTKATSGGTDVIAMILSKYSRLPFGQSIIYVDSLVVIGSFIAFSDWRVPLYSWIVIIIVGKVIDMVVEGTSTNKILIIISDKHKELSEYILHKMERGGTFLKAEGMYSGNEKKVIYLNASRREIPTLIDYIKEIDAQAFVSVINAHDVLGDGFKALKES